MKNISLSIIVSTFILVSCGGGGGGGGSTPTPPTTPAPTVNLSADPVSVLLENTSTLTWSSTNATSCSASWTTQTGSSGSEAVTISTAGNNSFSISCTGPGGSRSASVTVEGYRNTDGVVVDGYISGAEVCIDEDESWTCDSSESSTTSDNDGKFTIKYANGNLISIGGTDLDSQTFLDNLLITHKLTGHSDFKAVTPVTSVAAFMTDSSLINSALGIDSSIDVFIFDPVANKGDGGINDYLYEKGNQLTVLAYALQNITNNLNTTTETTQDYFKAITEEIEKEYTETETKVNIETEAFITKALDNVIEAKSVTIDETAKANTTKVLSGMLPIIQVKSSDDLTTSVIRFAVSTLQTDIQAIANGTASAETVTNYTEDILNYIAQDQNVDSDDIAPDISAIDDTASTLEDNTIEINVLLNDSYVTSSPFSLSARNGTNGSTSISNNLITYSPDDDYNGSDTFTYTITQGDKTSSAEVTVTIEAVNDAPSIDTASTIQAAENQTAVTTISVSDVDEDDLTLSMSGTDADSFDLSTDNILSFKEAPDFETKSSYSIILSLTDGTETETKDVIIEITNVNDIAPEFTSEATFSAAENQTAIGTVTATDADGDAVTFTISGTELAITSAGVLTFVSAPDYETKTSYTATIIASDGINETTQDITITIINLIEITAEENIIIDENIQTADYSITDAGGSSINLEIIRDYGKDFTPTNTIGNSDGTNFVLNDPVVINDGEIYQALSDIQISDGASITIKAGGKLISRYVEVDGSYSRPAFSTGTTFSNTYGEGVVLVSNDGTNYEEANSVGNQNILLFDGSSFKVEGTKDNPAEIRNISVAFATKEISDNASINIDYVNWRGGSLHPFFFYRTNAQSSYIRGSLKLTNSYLSFVNSVNLMRLDRRGRSEDIVIEDNVFHNSGGFSLDFNYQTSGLLRIQRNLYFGEDVYRTNKPAFLSIGITGGTSLQYPKHTDDRTKVLFKDNAILATPDSSKAIYCEDYDAYVPWEGNYFGYRADFDNTVRKTITDKNSDLSKTCSYPNSLILLESPRTWDIRPDFYFTQDDKIIMDVPIDYESATNKIIPFNIKATNSNNESKVLDMQMTVIDIDEPAEPIISEILDQISVQENTVFVSNFTVRSDSNDTVSMSLSGDDADKFEVSSNNLLAFKTAPNFEVPTDTDSDNVYKVTLTASTGSASASMDIEVNITNAVEESNAPILSDLTFTPSSVDVSSESKDVTVTFKATDESGVVGNTGNVPDFNSYNFSADYIRCNGAFSLVSGTDKDGVWSTTCTIPQSQPSGEYYFNTYPISDVNGVKANCYSHIPASNSCVSEVLTLTVQATSSQEIYYLYGGSDQSDYLGCYGCANTATDSVCNSVGTYGSNVSSSSIWNTVGSYGSTVGTYSPWNSVSTSSPEFFNQDKTTTYGKFTVNTSTANRTTVTKLTNIIDYFNNNSGDIAATREYACEQTQSAAPTNSLSSDKPDLNLSNKVIFD